MPLLDWLNKKQAVTAAARVPYRLLNAESAHGDPAADNWLIQGDNLEALKALLPFHAGRVKCIYIDTPYNTKSAFEHYDDNLEHSQWLSMIYPRLELLRELLAEDGSIWVSIDDNEAHYLKVAMDEVFGRGNFVCAIAWEKRYSPPPDTKEFGYVHDLILCYRKSQNFRRNLLPLTEDQTGRYKNPDADKRGPWKAMDYTCRFSADERPNLFYPIRQPNTGEEIWPKRTRVWAMSREVHERNAVENRLWWGAKGTNSVPALKNFLERGGISQAVGWQGGGGFRFFSLAMSLTLKYYQTEALDVLARFFDLARGATNEAALDAAFRQALAEQELPADFIAPYLSQGFASTPYVCLRIPTGGGKTLLGAHAIACAARRYTGQERPVALWLVPTNTIRQQTLNALRQPGHPYREALEAHFGVDGLRVLDIAECEQLRPQDFGGKTIVVVGTLQTLRVEDTSGRDVYAYKEAFEPHFERAPDLAGFERVEEKDRAAQPYLSAVDLGKVKRSFANLMYWHRPVVIIDEAHNARGALSYETFARLRPAALIEMTATPIRQGAHRSNVLYHVSAEALKTEQMIKLPIVLQAHPNWQEAVRDALLTRKRLAAEAVNEDDYLRPSWPCWATTRAAASAGITCSVSASACIRPNHPTTRDVTVFTNITTA